MNKPSVVSGAYLPWVTRYKVAGTVTSEHQGSVIVRVRPEAPDTAVVDATLWELAVVLDRGVGPYRTEDEYHVPWVGRSLFVSSTGLRVGVRAGAPIAGGGESLVTIEPAVAPEKWSETRTFVVPSQASVGPFPVPRYAYAARMTPSTLAVTNNNNEVRLRFFDGAALNILDVRSQWQSDTGNETVPVPAPAVEYDIVNVEGQTLPVHVEFLCGTRNE